VTYREFVLDLREKSPRLSVDEVRIFLGDRGDLKGYDARTQKLAGRTAVFDLDAGRDVSVILDGRTSTGKGAGDMKLLVPDSAFAGAGPGTFVYLYSKLGGLGNARADGPAETWSVRLNVPAPTPEPTPEPPSDPAPGDPSSLSGFVFYDDGSGQLHPLANVQILLLDGNGEVVAETTTGEDGSYSFTGLAAGTYTIAQGRIPFAFSYQDGPDYLGTIDGQTSGEMSGNDRFTVTLGAGQHGVNYNFTETLAG
jgi:hypothetical protein